MKIYVLDDYQHCIGKLDAVRQLDGTGIELVVLHQSFSSDDARVEQLHDAHGIVLLRERTRLSPALIDRLPNLRLIVQTGRMSDCIPLEYCAARGIAVYEGGGSPIAPAELCWTLILAASRRLGSYLRQLDAGHWQRTEASLADEQLGMVLAGRTLGVWALGKIGSRIAAYGQAFGMHVLVHGRAASQTAAQAAGFAFEPDRQTFLKQVDFLSLHLKLNDATRHILGDADLAVMKPSAILVNTSRAELIAPGALLSALDAGRPGFAALDVFEEEPAAAFAYNQHPKILATPHIGFVERDTYELYFGTAFRQVKEFAKRAAP